MKKTVLSLALGALALGGCSEQVVAVGSAATIYLTRPDTPPAANTKSQIPEHESWCYSTMGDTECYTKAQDVPPGRLVNVEPQNLYPLTPDGYKDELAGRRPAPAVAKPVALDAKEAAPVAEDKTFFDRITDYEIF